jgi:hypothetical protein
MAIAAQDLVKRAVQAMLDSTSIRTPVNELVRHLNDGQREIILHRPDPMASTGSIALVAGTKQALPGSATKLININRNTSGNKRAITKCERDTLDETVPGWHNVTGVDEVLHYIYDPLDPKVFYVYPPAAATGAPSVEAVWSALPTDIAEPADGSTYADVVGQISVPDIYGNALLDFMLFRSYSKNSKHAGNPGRALAHYNAFANALGLELKATVAIAEAADAKEV